MSQDVIIDGVVYGLGMFERKDHIVPETDHENFNTWSSILTIILFQHYKIRMR